MNEEKKLWPSWRYGPKGEAAIFEREEDVPKGWLDHPNKFKKEGKNDEVASASESEKTASEDAISSVKPSSNKTKKKSGN